MVDFIEEPFTVISPRYQHKLSCIFHRKRNPYVDNQNGEHIVILCHGYLSNKNALFSPQLSRDISDLTTNQSHSVRFDFHGCGESTGRDEWNYGGYENEAKDDLRSIVEYLRNKNEKYFIRGLIGHSRAGTTVLLYTLYYDDILIVVNIAGRYRLELDFRITKQAIERRQNLDINQIENIRQVKVLNIGAEKDDVVSCDDIYLYQAQLKNTKKSEVGIVPNANHLFTGKERELINIIQPWIQQSID
ncbi:unnamed protein product [Rotaria sp. Silwood2]|nr:unnamed protein product [Rotaria sp. Silwood2]CAF4586208.1 unnamed protein product [Rotaria sp. Silwood2]